MIEVGSSSLMMTLLSLKKCTPTPLRRKATVSKGSLALSTGDARETHKGYAMGLNSPVRNAHRPDRVLRIAATSTRMRSSQKKSGFNG